MREDWVECKLGDVLTVHSGKGLTAKKMSGEGYPVYGGNGITGYHSEYLLSEKKLIIGRVGVRCGVTHLTKGKSWITDNALIVKFKLLDFNLRFMQLKLQFENLNKLSNSTAQPVISGSKIYAYEISFPPLPEQRAIVAKIEELFSSLDSGIADLKKAQAQLKIYRQAVLKKAFENIKNESTLEEVKESSVIGLVRSNAQQNKEGIGVPYIKMNNIDMIGNVSLDNLVYVNVNQEELEKYSLKKGDILLNTRNSYELVGKTGVIRNLLRPVIYNNNIMKIRVKDNFDPNFICYQLISPFVRKQMDKHKKATTSVCALYQRNLFPLKLKIIGKEEQHLIVQEIESRLSVCDKVEESIVDSLEKSKALRQSILKKAFEGTLLNDAEIASCKSAKDYEPASVLLERIKAEKASRVKKVAVKKKK